MRTNLYIKHIVNMHAYVSMLDSKYFKFTWIKDIFSMEAELMNTDRCCMPLFLYNPVIYGEFLTCFSIKRMLHTRHLLTMNTVNTC